MSSDDRITAPDRTLKFAGTGMAMNFRCGACDKPSSQLGSGIKFLRGLRTKVCRACKERMS